MHAAWPTSGQGPKDDSIIPPRAIFRVSRHLEAIGLAGRAAGCPPCAGVRGQKYTFRSEISSAKIGAPFIRCWSTRLP